MSHHQGPQNPDKDAASKSTKKAPVNNAMSLLAEVSTLSWNLVIPVVGGVLLGHYIDKRSDSGVTWTMSLLVLGVLIAFSNLYNLYIEHSRRPVEEENNENTDEDINDKEEE